MNFVRTQLIGLMLLLVGVTFSFGKSIECKFRDINGLYTCEVENLETTSANNYIFEVTGTHETGKTNEDVTQFLVVDQNVEYFPGGLSGVFPHLKSIVINRSKLNSVFKSDLVGLSELEKLDLSDNSIVVIGPNLFEECESLNEILLSKNKIEKIDSNILKPLNWPLKTFDLLENVCITEKFGDPTTVSEVQESLEDNCTFSADDYKSYYEDQTEVLLSRLESVKQSKHDNDAPEPLFESPDVSSMQDQLDHLESEKISLENDIAMTQESLNERLKEVAVMQDKLANENLEKQKIAEKLTSSFDEIKQLQLTNENLKNELVSANNTEKGLQTVIFNVVRNATQLMEEQNHFDEKLEEKERKISILTADLKNLQAEEKRMKNERITEVQDLNNKILQLRKKETFDSASKAHYEILKANPTKKRSSRRSPNGFN